MRREAIQRQRNDLTVGSIWKKLILFALPLLGGSLIQQLFNTVDLFFVGNFVDDPNAMPAVGASSLIITLLVGFFTGMSVGSGVVVSLFYGAKNYRKLRQAVHTAIAIGIIGGVLLTIIGFFSAPTLLQWMNTPSEIFPLAVSYIQIYFLSLLSLVLYNMGTGILRAAGDSKSPLLYLVIGGVLNVILNYIFVVWIPLSVVGVALATLISQTVPAILVMIHLIRTQKPYRLIVSQIRIHKEMVRRIFRIGFPAGVQAIVITLSNMVVQYHINGFGTDAISAFTAYFRIELIMYLPIVAFGQAVTTFAGQNIGAQLYGRVKKGVLLSLMLGIGCTLITSSAVVLFSRQAFGLLNHSANVAELGTQVLMITGPLYFIYVFLEVFSGVIRGSGSSTIPTLIVILNMCGVRVILLSILVPIWHSVAAVAICYPITWITTSACLGIQYWVVSRKWKSTVSFRWRKGLFTHKAKAGYRINSLQLHEKTN